MRVEEETTSCKALGLAWIWIKDGLVERIPRVISLFDRGKEFKLQILIDDQEKTKA